MVRRNPPALGGQALVEFAIVLPLLMVLIVGIIEIGLLFGTRLAAQNGVSVMADLAAVGADWQAVAPAENARSGCGADPVTPVATMLDEQRLELVWHCHYDSHVAAWADIAYDVVAEAVAAPSPTPSASI